MSTELHKALIQNWVVEQVSIKGKLYQTEILSYCGKKMEWGSKPTILKVIQQLLDEQLINEYKEPRLPNSPGGQPRKYYTSVFRFQKGDRCDICYQKYWLDENNNKVKAAIYDCIECENIICSSCVIRTNKGNLCIDCANKHFQCPTCAFDIEGSEILFQNESGLYCCENPNCEAFQHPRTKDEIIKLWDLHMNPNYNPSPKITFSINVIPSQTEAKVQEYQDDRLSCPYCKKKFFEVELIKHIRKKHNRRWRQHYRVKKK